MTQLIRTCNVYVIVVLSLALSLVLSACSDPEPEAATSDAVPPSSTSLAMDEPDVAVDDDPMISATAGGDDAADVITMGEGVVDDVGRVDDALGDDGPSIGPPPSLRGDVDPVLAANVEFDRVLADVVTADGLVRYTLLRTHARMQRLERIIQQYAELDLPDDDAQKLALWINAYNANVLLNAARVSGRSVFTTVKDVPGFFDARTVTVAGDAMTLNALENDHIRTLGDVPDARVHAALVCAAMSCPPLRNEAYTADRLDAQLDDQARRWVNDPVKNSISEFGDGLEVSRIFEWYAKDFEQQAYGGVVGFLRAYARDGSPLAMRLQSAGEPEIEYLDYDWSLNDAPVTDAPQK